MLTYALADQNVDVRECGSGDGTLVMTVVER